jgi:hypothetical protein
VRIGLCAIVVAATVTPAAATKPCFDVCHLQQNQPLLLRGEGQIWIRRCETPKGGAEKCVVERIDVEGRVLATYPGSETDDERRFESKYLHGKKVAGLNYQTPWTDLKKPYTASGETATMTLRLDKSTLVCERSDKVIKRPLGCVPTALSVRMAGIGIDSKPEDPSGVTAVIATCNSSAGARDVVVVCQAKP